MMIKLTPIEVEQACAYWLHAKGYKSDISRTTDLQTPVAIDSRMKVICKFTRGGVECNVSNDEKTNG